MCLLSLSIFACFWGLDVDSGRQPSALLRHPFCYWHFIWEADWTAPRDLQPGVTVYSCTFYNLLTILIKYCSRTMGSSVDQTWLFCQASRQKAVLTDFPYEINQGQNAARNSCPKLKKESALNKYARIADAVLHSKVHCFLICGQCR